MSNLFANINPVNNFWRVKMYTAYQVVLSAEDGEYVQETFQTEKSAYEYIVANRALYGEGQHLFIKIVRHHF